MKMKITRQIFKAGKTLLFKECPTSKKIAGEKRAPKRNLTSEAVWKNNLKRSVFSLTLVLNENFKAGDYHLKLTYKDQPAGEEQFEKDREKFARTLRRKCKKNGIDIKLVFVKERKKGKHYHLHVICSKCPKNLIEESWHHGFIFYGELWENPNYYNLANYLLKEADESFRELGLINKKRFTRSRNTVMPQGETEEISVCDLESDPKEIKGYYVDGEVQRYEHPLTRLTCREYVMVEDGSRTRRMKKNKMRSLEYINYTKLLRESYQEEQLGLFGQAYL